MQPWARIIVLLVLLGIVASLGSALWQLSRGGDSQRMFRALALRVGLSVGLFLLLIAGWLLGVIEPHGIGCP